jgi:hypothetical protein
MEINNIVDDNYLILIRNIYYNNDYNILEQYFKNLKIKEIKIKIKEIEDNFKRLGNISNNDIIYHNYALKKIKLIYSKWSLFTNYLILNKNI